MKHLTLSTILLLTCAINCFAQFGADYSSYGFNFINDTYNEGLKNWTGNSITDANKFRLYQQDLLNNYALELKPINETLSINYDDSGYMDLNPCAFKINLRIKINQYSGNNDQLSFLLFTGSKKVELEFLSAGIYYTNSSNNSTLITSAAPLNEWITYSISLNSCTESARLMVENDGANIYTLDLPDDSTPQNINLSATTDGNTPFLAEFDHIFIYSDPIKWWLGPSIAFVDDTPADIQHFLRGMYFVSFRNITSGQKAYKIIVKQ